MRSNLSKTLLAKISTKSFNPYVKHKKKLLGKERYIDMLSTYVKQVLRLSLMCHISHGAAEEKSFPSLPGHKSNEALFVAIQENILRYLKFSGSLSNAA